MFQVIVHNRSVLHSCVLLLIFIILSITIWNKGTYKNNSLEQGFIEYFQDSTNLESLITAQIIFRHGARAPLYPFSTDPNMNYDYGVGNGQLLPIGKKQAYELGKYLRRRYDGFLDQAYSENEVYMLSSDTDRTIMTALMVLSGIFQVTREQEPEGKNSEPELNCNCNAMPVHTITDYVDNKISFHFTCDKHEMLKQEYFNSSTMKKFNEENKWVYDIVSEKAGVDPNFRGVKELMDTFKIQSEFGLKLPDWSKEIFPDAMRPSFDFDFISYTITPNLKHLLISPLVTEIVRNMDMKFFGNLNDIHPTTLNSDLRDYHNRSAKLYLFSGHDSTLSAFLNSFDVYDGHPPTYTSAVILELHNGSRFVANTNDTIQQGPFIRVFYKSQPNQPITELDLPECENPCTLLKFNTSYRKYLINKTQWIKECLEGAS